MSRKSNIVLATAFATLLAAPAFAMDQDTAAVTINSGRYLPELNLSAGHGAPAGAFASVRPGRVHVERFQGARASVAPIGGRDFQLEGRGLGE